MSSRHLIVRGLGPPLARDLGPGAWAWSPYTPRRALRDGEIPGKFEVVIVMAADSGRRVRFSDAQVRTVASHPPVVIRQESTLADAVRAFAVSLVHHLAVIDNGGYCTGLLSDRVVAGTWAANPQRFGDIAVWQIVEPPAPTVDSAATIGQAAQVMNQTRSEAVVVVDDLGQPLTVVSAGDLMKVLARQTTDRG